MSAAEVNAVDGRLHHGEAAADEGTARTRANQMETEGGMVRTCEEIWPLVHPARAVGGR